MRNCPITNEAVEDDCNIVIGFGYGSPKDLLTYRLGPVSHEVGENLLQYIDSLLPEGKSIEDFCTHDAE